MAEAMSGCSMHNQARRGSLAQIDVFKYRRAFDRYDDNKDGTISVNRMKDASENVGYRLTESMFQSLMENNDLNADARLTFEQFLNIIPRNASDISDEQHRLAELREKFQRYDTNKNGHISLSEAQWALQLELDISDQTALRLLNQFVKLDYELFVQFHGQIQKKKMEIYDKFGKYDKDLDGMISVDEAHAILHEELGFDKERSRAMVNRYDVNKDGLVSYVEFAEFYIAVEERKGRIRAAFRRVDHDEKGYVTLDEAREILQGYLGFSEAKSKQTVDVYDKNKDGKIDYEEFLEFFSMMEEQRQHLLAEFSRYDTNGDGKISCEEFQDMLSSEGYSEREIQTLMAGYDDDHDGYLNFDEFRKFLNFS